MVNYRERLPGRKPAPASHYVLAFTFGGILTIALSLLVGLMNPGDFWLAAGITALCVVYPSVSVGMKTFVSRHTVTLDAHGEESVELRWMQQAGAGAFLDLLVATTIATAVLLITNLEFTASAALLALLLLGVVDVGARYFLVRHRALK
ncbi:hypothetical protein [Arthrobacter monumenti]